MRDDPVEGKEFGGAATRTPGERHGLASPEVCLANGMASGWFRTIDRINAMLPGLEPVESGMVPLADWWPEGSHLRPLSPIQRLLGQP